MTAAGDTDEAGLALLGRIANKDRAAFRMFYDAYALRVGRFLLKMLKNPDVVDEAVNDVMLVVWQTGGDFDPARSRLTTWLFGIAHNKGLKVLEKQRGRWREQSLDEAPAEVDEIDGIDDAGAPEHSGPDNPERAILGWELGEILNWALERMTPEHRTVLELMFSEGRSYAEISEITGCPLNTVKTRIFHARKKLGEQLARRGYTPALVAGDEPL